MKYSITIITLLLYWQGFTQVVPNVSIDSLTSRFLPIYFKALKAGIFELPRDTTWLSTKKYEAEAITLEVPDKWLNLGGLSTVVEVGFDASGLYFPESYNDRPVLVGLFLLKLQGGSLNEVKEGVLKEYRTKADRIFDPGYVDSVYKFASPAVTKGYILRTRFFRKSNRLNQTRYDLILFSEKLKKGFSVMMSVQYDDSTYRFEKANALDVFAAKLFDRVILK